mmetsp:Transcript_51435/g.111968  ORF Transcript_51435/g.111968 Transcript_51435/m.111968 type:complete len:282 (-) Transcript_51435:842-1687(-)
MTWIAPVFHLVPIEALWAFLHTFFAVQKASTVAGQAILGGLTIAATTSAMTDERRCCRGFLAALFAAGELVGGQLLCVEPHIGHRAVQGPLSLVGIHFVVGRCLSHLLFEILVGRCSSTRDLLWSSGGQLRRLKRLTIGANETVRFSINPKRNPVGPSHQHHLVLRAIVQLSVRGDTIGQAFLAISRQLFVGNDVAHAHQGNPWRLPIDTAEELGLVTAGSCVRIDRPAKDAHRVGLHVGRIDPSPLRPKAQGKGCLCRCIDIEGQWSLGFGAAARVAGIR